MLCGREGNRRSGVALAMQHGLSGLSTYGLKGQHAGDEHPTYAPLEHGPLYLYLYIVHTFLVYRYIHTYFYRYMYFI